MIKTKKILKTSLKILFFISVITFIFSPKNPLFAATSDTINFQGKIVRNDTGYEGLNVTAGTPACVVAGDSNDTCDFQVKYYTASSGGTLLFTETFANEEIGQYGGVFDLSLGAGSATTSSECADGTCNTVLEVVSEFSDVYIEVGFAPGGAGSYTETFSRMPLEAVPYSMYSKYANSSSDAFAFFNASSSSGVRATPAEGMVYYDTTDNALKLYNGSTWESLASGASSIFSAQSLSALSYSQYMESTGIGTFSSFTYDGTSERISISGSAQKSGFSVYSDYSSTGAWPVVSFKAEGASFDAAVLELVQDGTGDILSAYSGSTQSFRVDSSGNTHLANNGIMYFEPFASEPSSGFNPGTGEGCVYSYGGHIYWDSACDGASEVQMDGGAGGGLWTDGGTFTYLTATTDDVIIGGDSALTAKFFFDVSEGRLGIGTSTPGAALDIAGASSTIANTSGDITITPDDTLVVKANDTEADNLQEWQDSSGNILGYISSAGYQNFSQTVNQSTTPSIKGSQTASTLQNGSSYTGTDTTMSTMYVATKFTASAAHTMGDFVMRIKESADITNTTSTITGYIYADDGGSPSKPTGSALASGTAIRFGTLTSTYQELSFGTAYTMTSGSSYWLVLKYNSAPVGGSPVLDSSVVSNMGATSTDGSTWTNTNVQLRYTIRGRNYYAGEFFSTNEASIYGLSTNSYGIYGNSVNSYGVRSNSTNYISLYSSSVNSIAVYGTSTNSTGVYGLSTSGTAVMGTSTNNIGIWGASTTNRTGYFFRDSSTATTSNFEIVSENTGDTQTVFHVRGDGTGDLVNIFDGTTEVFTILDGGNVGIGNATPAAKLDILSDSGDFLKFQSSSTTMLTVSSAGAVTMAGDMTSTSGTITLGSAGDQGSIRYNTTDNVLEFSNDGTTWIALASITKTITFNAEYPGAVLAGDTTANVGAMTSDAEGTAANSMNYYEWSSAEASLNDYDIRLRFMLPSDFDSWSTTAMTTNFATETTTDTDNQLDIYVYEETSGTVDVSDEDNVSSVAATWTTSTIAGADLSDCDTAGEMCVIVLRMFSKSDNYTRIGDIELSYNRKL